MFNVVLSRTALNVIVNRSTSRCVESSMITQKIHNTSRSWELNGKWKWIKDASVLGETLKLVTSTQLGLDSFAWVFSAFALTFFFLHSANELNFCKKNRIFPLSHWWDCIKLNSFILSTLLMFIFRRSATVKQAEKMKRKSLGSLWLVTHACLLVCCVLIIWKLRERRLEDCICVNFILFHLSHYEPNGRQTSTVVFRLFLLS